MLTAQEKRIARELGAIYVAYFAIIGAIKMSAERGSVPQWITAIVAAVGGTIAIYSIYSQREVARKRAAVDVFIKTEMDEKMIEAYDRFHTGLDEMAKAPSMQDFCTSPATRPHYFAVRKYLNVHELIATGIKKRVLDEEVCYLYWCELVPVV
jgi:Domain of unknown function (DUF4760)